MAFLAKKYVWPVVVVILIALAIGFLFRGVVTAEREAAVQGHVATEAKGNLNEVAKANKSVAAGRADPAVRRADCLRDAWNPEAC